MDAQQGFMEVSLGPSVTIRAQARAVGDVIFLPSDARGTPGELNGAILSQLNLPLELPGQKELSTGYCFRRYGQVQLCYVVTVGLLPTDIALSTFLAQALRAPELDKATDIWLPLMGTGAGQLPLEESFEITLAALRESGWLDRPGRQAVISTPGDLSARDAEALNSTIDQAQNALAGKPSERAAPERDAYKLAMTPAVQGALELAAALSRFPRASRRISSTLIFFSLCESQGNAAPAPLAADAAADLFASAVRELTGERYDEAWRTYFETSKRPSGEVTYVLPRPTNNVAAILRAAADIGKSKGAASIAVDHLIEALLTRKEMRLFRVLEQLGVDPALLLREYGDARLGQITMKFRNDVASDVDRLGYEGYATAIVDFLTHSETPPPLSISIQAPWGGGKSSLMNLVREQLDPKEIREKHKPKIESSFSGKRLRLGEVLRILDRIDGFSIDPDKEPSRLWTVWFNAWKYETSEQIWAGLVDAIVSQVAERLPLIEREKFFLKLQLARIDDGIIRRRIYDRIANIWWSKVRAWVLTGAGVLASLIGLQIAAPAVPLTIMQAVGWWAGYGALAVPIIMSIYLIGTYFSNRTAVQREPASFSLSDFIRVPDYDKSMGEIHQIHADLRRVLGVVPRDPAANEHAPIVIFIDDLDRCSPSKVAGVVEGVSMLLASDTYRCMFVIGMDPQMVAAALEKAHEDVRKHLPRYERTVPLGWRFMDKFVQLPFTIPPAPAAQFDAYLDWLSDTRTLATQESAPIALASASVKEEPRRAFAERSEAAAERVANFDATDSASSAPKDSGQVFVESRDVGAIIRAATRDAVANPREMKRMINLARFYLALRAARRRRDGAWRAPSPEQYARWIAVTLRWPDMMRWLQWGSDEANWKASSTADSLIVRRLRRLEEIAADAGNIEGWKFRLQADLMVPVEAESDWGCDPKLFEFFQGEGGLELQQRLSAAAQRGFW